MVEVMRRNRPYAVGLTGGIASGKSTVARAFADLGVPVLDADEAARSVLRPGSDGLQAVVHGFGASVLGPNGDLDRAALREHVFADANARRKLEAIVHPRVRMLLSGQLQALQVPYAVLAIPLIRETWPAYDWLDRILVVDVPEALQRERLMQRDAIDVSLAESILAAQATRAQRLAIAHDVLDNRGDVPSLRDRIDALHRQYLRLSSGH